MTKRDKIQHLLVSHLLKEGRIELLLPDGIKLEIGITQEDRNGDLVKCKDYCWVMASQKSRNVALDAYNLGLRYEDDNSKILLEDGTIDDDTGCRMKAVSVV